MVLASEVLNIVCMNVSMNLLIIVFCPYIYVNVYPIIWGLVEIKLVQHW